jgi:hypothetical protein
MAVGIVLIYWFVLVSGSAVSSTERPQNDDVKSSFSTFTTALSVGNEESSSTTIYHPVAGRLIPEKVALKRSEPESKKAIDNATTNIPDKQPGATRIAILLAVLLLSALLVPMAFAEPTSTSAPRTSLTLPSPSPCTTAFNATGTALSADLQEKGKPQTWYWIPPNSSDRTSVSSLLSLIPFLVMGFFFLLPSFAAGDLEKDITIIDDIGIGGRSAPADTSPVWDIFLSTTTVWPPASTGPITVPHAASPEPTEKPISVAGNGGGCGPSAEVGICTEANPAVCPIVLGRKPWKVV